MGYLVTKPELEAIKEHLGEIVEQLNANTATLQAITGMTTPGNPIDELAARIERLEGLAVLQGQLEEVTAKLNGCDASLGDFGARLAKLESSNQG